LVDDHAETACHSRCSPRCRLDPLIENRLPERRRTMLRVGWSPKGRDAPRRGAQARPARPARGAPSGIDWTLIHFSGSPQLHDSPLERHLGPIQPNTLRNLKVGPVKVCICTRHRIRPRQTSSLKLCSKRPAVDGSAKPHDRIQLRISLPASAKRELLYGEGNRLLQPPAATRMANTVAYQRGRGQSMPHLSTISLERGA
jgi:hypothetical protein